MRHTDIAIVGGGLAGSTAAAMLGRAGIDAVLIDPHPAYPPDFRCEKLDGSQVRLLPQDRAGRRRPARRHPRRRTLDRALRPSGREAAERSIRHSLRHLVNTMRAEIPQRITFIHRQGHRHRDQRGPPDA